MNPRIRNIIAVILGIIIGAALNMAIIQLSPYIIAPPVGVNPMDTESIRMNMHLYRPAHFIFPFLAHALGTLVGAYAAVRVAASKRMVIAIGIGIFFLLGGIASAYMLPAPSWFIVIDLFLAYLPMAWIGGKMALPKLAI